LLFPPVIFNAGFTLKSKDFVKNIGAISAYAVVGTIISTIVISLCLYGLNMWLKLVELDFIETLMFGALLSPIDTVATISVLTEMNVIPTLYSLVFGESVLNDAVAIALFTALSPYVGKELELATLGKIIGGFFVIVFGSVGIGAAVGFVAAFLAAQEKRFDLSVTFQSLQILIMAYISYVLAEYFDISGVISLFVCAMVMSHYCWYSISELSRRSLFLLAGGLDFLSELMVFVSFGIILFTPTNFGPDCWNGWFIVITLVLCFVARACNTFVLSFLLNLCRKVKISLKCQVIMWYCGMRGIVTLLLVLNLAPSPNRSMMINTTFVIIFFTNFVIGLTMRPLVKAFDVGADEEAANLQDPSQQLPPEYITRAQLNSRSRFAQLWFLFDNNFLKKAFGGRKRILIEDEKDIRKEEQNDDGSVAIVDVEKPDGGDGETEMSSLKPKKSDGSGKAEDTSRVSRSVREYGEVEYLSSSDSDSDSGDDSFIHATVETASESLRNFRTVTSAQRKRHHHHHHHGFRAAPSGYGTATTSHIPSLGHGLDDEVEYDDESSPKYATQSAVYSSEKPK